MSGKAEPVRRWHRRGHEIVAFTDKQWRWARSGRWIKYGSGPDDPPCNLCGREPTSEGYDACLGEVEGAISACCGHGYTDGHVTYLRGFRFGLPRLTEPDTGGVDHSEAVKNPDIRVQE